MTATAAETTADKPAEQSEEKAEHISDEEYLKMLGDGALYSKIEL